MIDVKKRQALKMLGGATAVAAIPSLSAADCFNGQHVSSQSAVKPLAASAGSSTEMSLAISSGKESMLTLTNNSVHPIDVKHVHPGIVHAGDKTFDINTVFKDGAQSIAPGTSREFAINTTASTQPEASFPRHLYRQLPQRAVSVTGVDQRGQFVNSTRSFYS